VTKWVPVLVRLEDYAEVTTLVADREAGRHEPALEVEVAKETVLAEPAPAHDSRLVEQTPWSVDDLRKLAEGTSETAKRWTLAMDVCSAIADTGQPWLSTSEVANRSGMTVNEWRDAPRKITRHLKANYPAVPVDKNGGHVWPLRGEAKPGAPEVHWAMNIEQARRWRGVRGLEA
jgi:hypothetical protein